MEERVAGITEMMTPLLEKTVDTTLAFLRKKCKEYFESMDVNLVTSLMKLMESHMYKPTEMCEEWEQKEGFYTDQPKPGSPEQAELFKLQYAFAFIWALGGNLDDTSRIKFDEFVRELLRCAHIKCR